MSSSLVNVEDDLHRLSIQDTNENGYGFGKYGGTCAICLENIVLEETAFVKGCEHAYCVTCIFHWATSVSCPQCKLQFELVSDDYIDDTTHEHFDYDCQDLYEEKFLYDDDDDDDLYCRYVGYHYGGSKRLRKHSWAQGYVRAGRLKPKHVIRNGSGERSSYDRKRLENKTSKIRRRAREEFQKEAAEAKLQHNFCRLQTKEFT